MESISDSVNKMWLMQPFKLGGMRIRGISTVREAAWHVVMFSAKSVALTEKELLDGIQQLEQAAEDLKKRYEEDYGS